MSLGSSVRVGTSTCDLSSDDFRYNLLLGRSRRLFLACELSLGNFRAEVLFVAAFGWELSLEAFAWDLRVAGSPF